MVKSKTLNAMRQVGENVYAAKARIKAGDSQTRAALRERCEEEGVDYDEALLRDDIAEIVAKGEAAELEAGTPSTKCAASSKAARWTTNPPTRTRRSDEW
jgi:hypothetical protein